MTVPPNAAFRVCLCAHTQRRHFEGDGPCQAGGCGCGSFRGEPDELAGAPVGDVFRGSPPAPVVRDESPSPAPPDPTPVARPATLGANRVVINGEPHQAPPANPAGDVLEAARKSTRTRTRTLGHRVEKLLTELRAALLEERAADAARAEAERRRREMAEELARIETRRAELREQLGKKPARQPLVVPGPGGEPVDTLGRSVTGGDYPCGKGCEQRFTSRQGVALHERRAHGDLRGAVRKAAAR